MQNQGQNQGNQSRPSVLDTMSETQMDELERQYSEGDHQAWDTLTNSYGWTKDQGNKVWQWFSQIPDSREKTPPKATT